MRMKRIALSILMILVLGAALSLAAQERSPQAIRVKVTAEQANLRERPDIGSAVVQQIPEGTVLQADGKEGEWYLVRYALDDGGVRAGYIHESLVVVTTDPPGLPVRDPREARPDPAAAPRPKPAAPVPSPAVRPLRPAGPVPSPFEFSASILGGPVDPADLNDGAKGAVDYNAALLGLQPSGAADPIRLGLGLGLELSYWISPGLAVGVGVDHFRGGNRSQVEYAAEGFQETLIVEPAFQATPIKLNLRLYPGPGFYIRGGLGAYHVKAGYLYRFERDETWQQAKGTATAWALGAEAAFGGDLKVGRNLLFFAEAGFRLARWRGLKGEDTYSNFVGVTETQTGTLYLWRQGLDAVDYALLSVRESRPDGNGVTGVRAADINLTGTSLRAGLRFRF